MKIQKFNRKLFYTDKEMEKNKTKYEDLAIKAGFNIDDTVYNSVAQRRMVITQKNDPRVTSNSSFCTLGAVGENLDKYTKIKSSTNDANRAKLYHIEKLKKSISNTYNKALIPKDELKTLVNNYIDKL